MTRTASCRNGTRADAPDRKGTRAASGGDLWERFHRSRSAKLRNSLVESYLPLVWAISARLSVGLPQSIEIEDLVSAGTFGLIDAIERYDRRVSAAFQTYCVVRIRGAILDELRYLNWAPRTQCQRATRVSDAIAVLKGESGRVPTPREIAEWTGMKLNEVHRTPKTGQRRQVPLSALVDGLDDKPLGDIVKARGVCDPVDVLQEKERRDLLAGEIRKLPRPERLMVMLYYFEELTMKQIGEVLDVTESRVCQMHAEVLARLQQRLAELDERRSDRSARV